MPRVVEKRLEPSRHSKVLAVNPRTLEILNPTGLTRLMLERGFPIRGVRFYRRERPLAGFSLDGIHPDYPFMLPVFPKPPPNGCWPVPWRRRCGGWSFCPGW